MDICSVYELRIQELLPFTSKTAVRKAIRNLKFQIQEEAIMKRLESQLALSILQTVKNNVSLIPGHYQLKGFGDEMYLFSVGFSEDQSDVIFVRLKRLELKTEHVYRHENRAAHYFEKYPTFDLHNVRADEKLVFGELENIRSAFKKTWENLNLPKTPSNSENGDK